MDTPALLRRCHAAIRLAGLAILMAVTTAPAHAGRSCEPQPPSAQAIERGMKLAALTQDLLNLSGARVVLLARAGQDLRRYRLRYSHAGWAYRNEAGAWRIVHKLNDCGAADAALYRQGLGEFFLDDPFRFEAAWVVPTADAQARLIALLGDDAKVKALHVRPYSVVSYAWGTRYQQSNQWAAELLATAMDGDIRSREQAQAWLRYKGYTPTVLQIDAITRLGGRLSAANVAFDDHPNEKRFSDRIETVTVDSLFSWLQSARLGGTAQSVRL
ncbi:MAG: DUF2145 domain-containing protein [Burkholderiales bacterium]|nr:DUF2145 domain-containing protein [Burkholderiales bacterium]